MSETVTFTGLILTLQRNRAKELVRKIREENLAKYADALITVILVQANRELQKQLPGYYMDEVYITDNAEREKVSDLIDKMCDAVRKSGKENTERIFCKAVSYIDANLADNGLYAGSVAELVGVSGSVLAKLFESRMGTTPTKYIAEKRIENSIGLLMKKELSIKDVAKKSGFSSAEAYIRAFKKIYGKTPGKYQEEE